MPEIRLTISDENEGTEAPWWVILDPCQMMKPDIHTLAGMVTGPFFSRGTAETYLYNHAYNFSKRAQVFCMSGYRSKQYKDAWRKGLKEQTDG